MGKRSSNKKLVPGCESALNQWKYEFASELGLPVGQAANLNTEFASELGTTGAAQQSKDYWGDITARDAGYVGGNITRRLIQEAQKSLFS